MDREKFVEIFGGENADTELRRFELCSAYLNELDAMKRLPRRSVQRKMKEFVAARRHLSLRWVDVFDEETGEIIGFLNIGTPPNCHPDADYYIQEAYIIPERRREGIMTRAATEFINAHKGVYCFFIAYINGPAKGFFGNLFSELEYRPVRLRGAKTNDRYAVQYGFEPAE